jgi:hypothetical protein
VVCTDEKGNELHATPGTAVEKTAAEDFRPLPVTGGDLETFRKAWEEKRMAALKADALQVMQRDARRYMQLVDEFQAGRDALDEKRDILARWTAEERSGKIGPDAASMEADRAELQQAISDLRETQFLLERLHYRLAALKEYHDQGFGEGNIREGLSTRQFFERFSKDRVALERSMAEVRHAAKLLVHRNRDNDPTLVTDVRVFYAKRVVRAHRPAARTAVKKVK